MSYTSAPGTSVALFAKTKVPLFAKVPVSVIKLSGQVPPLVILQIRYPAKSTSAPVPLKISTYLLFPTVPSAYSDIIRSVA